MEPGNRRRPSMLESFTLSPLPYPVLLIFMLVIALLSFSWSFTYESTMETAAEQINWVLIATPILLLLALRWLSTVENLELPFGLSGGNRYQGRRYNRAEEGSSPWGVAALLLLLFIMISYQSTFLDRWFP